MRIISLINKFQYGIVLSALLLFSGHTLAGGITLDGTRIIYPAGVKQSTLSVRNTSDQANFLVQSWIENIDGKKTDDFIVTPPLYLSGPGNENTLRLMYVGDPVKTDRETLYYFHTKAIPSIDKKNMEEKNILMVAAVTRIKLFVRPSGLKPEVDSAPSNLTFKNIGNQIRVENPTPYHITMVKIKIGGNNVPDTMVEPFGTVLLNARATSHDKVAFRTINDFGAATSEITSELK